MDESGTPELLGAQDGFRLASSEMLLLVTGASGAGKSTVRERIAPGLAPKVQSVELRDVLAVPAVPTLAWRQQAAQAAVLRALALHAEDRHLLLCGDPVAAGEVLAAPSATQLDALAVCLLDLSVAAQTRRLARRGDDPALLHHHHAFADWMRGHARDPGHMPHVLRDGGWAPMHWDRLDALTTWECEVLDTTALTASEVADAVAGWCRRALRGQAPLIHQGRAGA